MFIRQNVLPFAVFCASAAAIAASVARLVSAPPLPPPAHMTAARPSFPPAPGRQLERSVSAAGDCVALLYTSDGVGVVPVGATVMLQSLRPAGTVSRPIVVASSSLECGPFRGICGVSWRGPGVLEIESYDPVSVSQPESRGVHLRVKLRDAGQEAP